MRLAICGYKLRLKSSPIGDGTDEKCSTFLIQPFFNRFRQFPRINTVIVAHHSYRLIDRRTKLQTSSQSQPTHADDIYTVAHWTLTEAILVDAFEDNFI